MNRQQRRAAKNKEGLDLQKMARDALLHHQAGRLKEAEQLYRRLLAVRPDSADVNANLGSILRESEHPDEAIIHLQRALSIRPDHVEALNNLGNAFRDQEKFAEAFSCYERALLMWPENAEILNNIGTTLNRLDRTDDAIAHLQRALALRPDYIDAMANLGVVYNRLERSDDTIACYERLLSLDPNHADARTNIGSALMSQGRLEEALAQFKHLITLNPDAAAAHWNEAFVSLLTGDFATGWPKSEWRWRQPGMKSHPFAAFPLWDGGDLTGKTILLHCEQGLGDDIQFVRYAPLVKAKGGQVWLSCKTALAKLFGTVEGVDRIFTQGQEMPLFDCQAPLLSLPWLVGTTLETIPAAVPYLQADPAAIAGWRERLAGCRGLRVGVVWRGNPEHKNDRNRSMTAALYARFLDVPGVSIVNLQKDTTPAELETLRAAGPVFDAAPLLQDFADTAALASVLDLVIAVDTSVCHLAGALNRPTWTLLPFAPDWRWLIGRDDSPWYPAMRLFRQVKAKDWNPVISAVRVELAGRAAS